MPLRDFSSISSTYHSATPCLARRSSTMPAFFSMRPVRADRMIGSSAAISGMPSCSRSYSIFVLW